MLRNYVKAALRSLIRRKGQTLISIAGLTAGLLACILILAWVRGEISYDRFHANGDRIYRLIHSRGTLWPCAIAPYMKATYAEVENTARLHHRFWQMTHEDKTFEGTVKCVDPSFLDMFSFELIQGDREKVISSPQSIAITRTMARRIFGDENVIGKTLLIEKRFPLTVTGILNDTPFNSHLQFDALVNLEVMRAQYSWYPQGESWTDGDLWVYVQVAPGTDTGALQTRLQQLVDERFPTAGIDVDLQPVTGIHLYGATEGTPAIIYVYIFIGAAVLILLSACINYINLSTARAGDRAREIGIRKVVGAGRSALVRQFMGETVLVALSAAVLALVLTELLRPQFSALVGREIPLDITGDPLVILGVLGMVFITGLLAGIYPSLMLSSLRPVKILRSSVTGVAKGSTLRRLLVVGQFAVSIFLLAGVAVVYGQLDYIRQKNLGYDHRSILHLELRGDIYSHLRPIINDLDSDPGVLAYTFTNTLLHRSETSTDEVSWEGRQEGEMMYTRVLSGGYGFADVFGIEMAQGRFFSPDFSTDIEEGYILNEAAVAAMGVADPVGKKFSCLGRDGTIIGIVKDFHFRSMHYEIQPLVLTMRPDWSDNLAIKVSADDVMATAGRVQAIIRKHVPDYPAEVQFFEDEIGALYNPENRIARIFAIASGLAIFLSCLGTLGLVSHTVRRRTREIGVRKVFGASVAGIVRLITREFVVAALIACTIAWPIAFYASTRWLQNFAFSISISWLMMIVPGLIILLVAVLTAGSHAIGAARVNPIRSLRNE